MTVATAEVAGQLAALVGAAHLAPAGPADGVDGVAPRWVVAPGSADEVAAVLRVAGAAGRAVVPRGGGTKLGWGSPPRAADLVLSTARLDAVVEHAWGDMTVTVQSGCSVARLQQTLAAHGQRLALDPLWPAQATVGGILATNDSGALRVRFGALRDQVLGVTLALADGTLAKSGGKVVKNVAGYDLPKLLTGAFGTLGVVTQATFRLYPLPAGTAAWTVSAPMVAPLQALLSRILDSTLVPTGLQLRAAAAAPPALDVRFEGLPGPLAIHAAHLRALAGAAGCGAAPVPAASAVWQAREALWGDATPALVARLSVLPAQLGALCDAVGRVAAARRLDWQIVAQAVGTGLLRLADPDAAALPAALAEVRAALAPHGGTVVVLDCQPGVKAQTDVWGEVGDDLPLMRRVKAQFDPQNLLNPGRFVGGI